MPVDERPVRHLHAMRPVGPATGDDPARAGGGADVDAVGAKGGLQGRGVARVVAVVQAVVRVDNRHRHAVADEDLRDLGAARAAAEHDEAAGKAAGAGRLVRRPGVAVLQAIDARDRRLRSDCQHDVGRLEDAPTAGPVDGHAPGPVQPALATDHDGPRFLEGAHVARVVRDVPTLAVDHPVAPGRRLRPWIVAAERVDAGRMQEGLGRHAGKEGAFTAGECPLHDGDARAALPGQVRRRLTGRTGPDHHELEPIHAHPLRLPRRPQLPRRRADTTPRTGYARRRDRGVVVPGSRGGRAS